MTHVVRSRVVSNGGALPCHPSMILETHQTANGGLKIWYYEVVEE